MKTRTTNRIYAFVIPVILTMITSACGAYSPLSNIKTGPTQVMDLVVKPTESASDPVLNLEFRVGALNIAPGAGEELATGKATFNVETFTPQTVTEGNVYTISQGDRAVKGIPKCPDDVVNTWDLQLGNKPMALKLKAGPYDGKFELGGLSLKQVTVDEAGSNLVASFSEPNKVEMTSFEYQTGGSKVTLKGLANANFNQMTFMAGAGEYTLSYDGKLQRDANVSIDAGLGTLTIIVPTGVNAKLTFDGGLTSINTSGSWSKNETIYTLAGNGPTINFLVKMGAGTLNLVSQ